jgi:hypothetical protein
MKMGADDVIYKYVPHGTTTRDNGFTIITGNGYWQKLPLLSLGLARAEWLKQAARNASRAGRYPETSPPPTEVPTNAPRLILEDTIPSQ